MFDQAYSTHQQQRFYLRFIAIASAAIGIVLSACTLVSALRTRWNMHPARVVTGVSLIPLSVSILWHLYDITYPRVASGRRSPPAFLVIVLDGAGFFAFLALMIANGIVIKELAYSSSTNYGMGIMLTYNQFPWMVCSAFHAILVFQQLRQLGGPRVCEHCRQEMGQSATTKRGLNNDYAPLVEHRDSYEDAVETGVATSPMSTHNNGS